MSRNQYNLYISNISDKTNEDCLISYFSKFGKIESYTFFKKTSQRTSAALLITYGLSVDINKIIQYNQRIHFDDHHLFLRRTLPLIRPAFERFMSSNELLISLDYRSTNKEFNEKSLRKYFSQYGSIVSCRIVIFSTTFLLNFVETNCVDYAILDEPHFFNKNQLILRKYVSPNQIDLFRSKKLLFNLKSKFSIFERIRRLEHIIEAIQFGQSIELRLIKCFYEEKKFKSNQIRKISDDIQRIKNQNNSLKLNIEQNQRIGKYLTDLYKTKIENQQNQIKELIKAIDSLNF